MDDMNMLDGTVDEVLTRIERCADPLVLDQARREELAGKSRANVVRALNRRMAELPDPGEEPGTAANIHGSLDRFSGIPSTADRLKIDWPIGAPIALSLADYAALGSEPISEPGDLRATPADESSAGPPCTETLPIPEPGSEAWEDLERRVDEWHASADTRPVHEYLGITLEQYALWFIDGRRPEALADSRSITAEPERLDLSEADAKRLEDAVAELRRPLAEAIGGGRKYIPGGQMDRRISACTDPGQIQQAIEQEEARKSRARPVLLEALLSRLAALLGGTVTQEARAMVADAVPDDGHMTIDAETMRNGAAGFAYAEEDDVPIITAMLLHEHAARNDAMRDGIDEQDGEPQTTAPYPPATGDVVAVPRAPLLAVLDMIGARFDSPENWVEAARRVVDMDAPDGARADDDIKPLSEFESGDVGEAVQDLLTESGSVGVEAGDQFTWERPASRHQVKVSVHGGNPLFILEAQTARLIPRATPDRVEPSPLVEHNGRWYLAGEWQGTRPPADSTSWLIHGREYAEGGVVATSRAIRAFWVDGQVCRPVKYMADQPGVDRPRWQSFSTTPLDQCIQRLADDHETLLEVIAHHEHYDGLIDALVLECQQDDREWLRRALARRAVEVHPAYREDMAGRIASMNEGWDRVACEFQSQRDALREQVRLLERENEALKRDQFKQTPFVPTPAVNVRLAKLAAAQTIGLRCTEETYNLIDELHRAEADARAMRMKLRLAGVTLEDR